MMPTAMARDATDPREARRPYDQPPTVAPDAPWLVVYDADCGFCRWSLACALALDRHRRLVPVALGTAQADALLADLSAAQRAASWHLLSPEHRRYSAGAAAAPLLRLVPGGRVPAALLDLAPNRTERVYDWVVRHRSTLGRALPARAKRWAETRIESPDASGPPPST
jgi:predicted DCC family thiol-disulfide oxidoreductase YuxK